MIGYNGAGRPGSGSRTAPASGKRLRKILRSRDRARPGPQSGSSASSGVFG